MDHFITLSIAGCLRFLTFSQCFDRPACAAKSI
jgi:hypothetical protein